MFFSAVQPGQQQVTLSVHPHKMFPGHAIPLQIHQHHHPHGVLIFSIPSPPPPPKSSRQDPTQTAQQRGMCRCLEFFHYPPLARRADGVSTDGGWCMAGERVKFRVLSGGVGTWKKKDGEREREMEREGGREGEYYTAEHSG